MAVLLVGVLLLLYADVEVGQSSNASTLNMTSLTVTPDVQPTTTQTAQTTTRQTSSTVIPTPSVSDMAYDSISWVSGNISMVPETPTQTMTPVLPTVNTTSMAVNITSSPPMPTTQQQQPASSAAMATTSTVAPQVVEFSSSQLSTQPSPSPMKSPVTEPPSPGGSSSDDEVVGPVLGALAAVIVVLIVVIVIMAILLLMKRSGKMMKSGEVATTGHDLRITAMECAAYGTSPGLPLPGLPVTKSHDCELIAAVNPAYVPAQPASAKQAMDADYENTDSVYEIIPQ